jgi:hypothetical protein
VATEPFKLSGRNKSTQLIGREAGVDLSPVPRPSRRPPAVTTHAISDPPPIRGGKGELLKLPQTIDKSASVSVGATKTVHGERFGGATVQHRAPLV